MKFYGYAGFKDNEYQGWIVTPCDKEKDILDVFKRYEMDIDSYTSCEVYMDGTVKIIPPDSDLNVQK